MFFGANTHCLLGRNGEKWENEIEKYESTEEKWQSGEVFPNPHERGGSMTVGSQNPISAIASLV